MNTVAKVGYVFVFSGLLVSLIGWVIILIDNNREGML